MISISGKGQEVSQNNRDSSQVNLINAKLYKAISKLSLKAYGVVNYYNYDWQTDPDRRNAVDLERINMYMKYRFTDKITLKTEFEIEHGGTGATMELDKFEEFGEYEAEIEAGGAVLLEQLNITFNFKPWLNIRAGRLKLYMGVSSKLDLPVDYFTGYRSTMENTILPLGWYEIGVEAFGDFGAKKQWSYKLYLVNGLSSAGFSSANWIKRGFQRRFEVANAENLAVAGRFDYNLKNKSWVGVSGYFGNSNDNRPKPDLKGVGGYVSIVDVHTCLNYEKFKVRGMLMYGHLQNSDLISEANRNLSNNLNVKRTPVGSDILGFFVESGYNVLAFSKKSDKELFIFGRYDFYDTMYDVSPGIFKNPRWERSTVTFGINYFPHPEIVIKSHYAMRTLGLSVDNKENTFLIGIGFKFSTRNY
jgi:hypothetical protein